MGGIFGGGSPPTPEPLPAPEPPPPAPERSDEATATLASNQRRKHFFKQNSNAANLLTGPGGVSESGRSGAVRLLGGVGSS